MVKYRANRYDGTCEHCGQTVPAGHGRVRLARNPTRWMTSHTPKTWRGSPISGGWVGGCPENSERRADDQTVPPDPERGEQARRWLYFHLTGDSGEPPPFVVPGTDEERTRLTEAFVRLADHLDHNPLPSQQSLDELHKLAMQQGWL